MKTIRIKYFFIMPKQKITIIAATVLVLIGGAVFFNNQKEGNDSFSGSGVLSPIQEVYAALPEQAKPFYYQQSEGLTKPVPERLVELDQLTIGCFGADTIMQMSPDDTNLGGQCCGVLKDIEAYEAQLPALHAFIEENGNIDQT